MYAQIYDLEYSPLKPERRNRMDRVAKYNRLLLIEVEPGTETIYRGRFAFPIRA